VYGSLLRRRVGVRLWCASTTGSRTSKVFRTFYGPMVKAFGALDCTKQESFAAELIALAERFNRATDGSLVAPGQYAEVVIKRR
jgi:hypothetical protein